MRTAIGVAVLGVAVAGFGPAADPAPAGKHAAVELVLAGPGAPARVEVDVSVGGVPVPAVWDDTFARLFAFFDRNADGGLDAAEAALLPSPRAVRYAMGNGFTPPVGTPPAFKELDRDGDGRASPEELAAYYRGAGVGTVRVAAGHLPWGAELTAALLKNLDADADGRVTEAEWKAAADALRKLDKNDDELIGAGELVPKVVYPGAAGSVLLAPPGAEPPPAPLDRFPVVLLPAAGTDTHWAADVARRNPMVKADDLPAWRVRKPDARWVVRLDDKAGAAGRFTFAGDRVRVDGWAAAGKADESVAAARRQITARPEAPEPGAAKGRRAAGGELGWLTPVADRDGDGALDQKEVDAWLDLQARIARGQVLLSVFDGAGLFELVDADHDGALSTRELRGAWDRVRDAGCLTGGAFDPDKLPAVLLVAASHGYPRTLAADARRGPAWFRAMDRNGDGDVSRREFTGPAGVFDRLDLDRDGLVTAEEAEKADVKK